MLFKLNNLKVDDTKRNVLVVLEHNRADFTHIYGYVEPIVKYLEKRFNVFFYGSSTKNLNNHIKVDDKVYKKYNTERFLRKEQEKDSKKRMEYNRKIVRDDVELFASNHYIDFEHIFMCADFRLPFKEYGIKGTFNEFHDTIDSSQVQKVNELITKIDPFKENGVLMFLAFKKHLMMEFLYYYKSIPISCFLIDPMFYWPFFEMNFDSPTYYHFVDDNRGNRKFKEFPIGELQHCIYDTEFFNEKMMPPKLEKSKDFFFIGGILYDKGSRTEDWYTFLNDLRIDNSNIFVPLTINTVPKNESQEIEKRIVESQQKYEQLFNDIFKHPMFDPGRKVYTHTLHNVVPQYKYGLILKCVSHAQSFNYRIIQYLKYDVLPLIDFRYDDTCLQIPEKFQQHLVVNNSKDIENIVKYFNENNENRIQLLKEMREYYKIDTWMNDSKFVEDKLNGYFGEI